MTPSDLLIKAGLNLIQQALSVFDSDLRLVHANKTMQAMFDLPDHLVAAGARFEDVIWYLAARGEYGEIDDLDSFVQARVDLAQAFEPHYMERTRANGRTISVEGAPLSEGGWVSVYTDITAVKTQEQLLRTRSELLSEEVLARSEELSATNRKLAATNLALEETQRQLRESEARTRLTTEMMPAHIAHVDAQGRYTYSNQRLTSILPGRPSDIVGLHISDALGQAVFARVDPYLQRAHQGESCTFEFTDTESSRRLRVAFNPDAQQNGVYILSTDVTEETQARVALQQTRRREIAAQLTSGLAHDFSNLLTIILGAQSKLNRIVEDDTAHGLIHATRKAAERGGALLHRIAEMTGARTYMPEPTDLGSFLADFETLARSALPPGITFDMSDIAMDRDGHARVLVDPGMLQDSLLNLILNARDAIDSAKGRIVLQVVQRMHTWLEFTVADTGPGFSPGALKRGLEPFYSTKGSEGSGLGLSMVYDMSKLAGGDLRLGNQAEGGACVVLRLPLRLAPVRPQAHMVLLVEDEPDLRTTIRDMLTDEGHTVIEAASADEALALAESIPDISLVLSDVMLKGARTGVDLCTRLDRPRVLLMTSLPSDDVQHKAARAVAPVLPKPFTAPQLAGFLAAEGAVS